MAESATAPPPPPPPPNPNFLVGQTPAVDPPASATTAPTPLFSFPKRPALRLTSEFDSDTSIFFHKVSCKLFDSLAKFKLSFQNDHSGHVSLPQLAFISKYLSLHYDLEDRNTLVKASVDVSPSVHLRAAHDVKVPLNLPACL